MSGQSITDRITAAQHSVTGSAITKIVCKATTHEIMGPKKKHLDYQHAIQTETQRGPFDCTVKLLWKPRTTSDV